MTFYNVALEVRLKRLGDHTLTASTLSNLGCLWAEPRFKGHSLPKVRSARRCICAPVRLCSFVHSHTLCARATQPLPQALEHYERAADMLRRLHGPSHEATLAALYDVAVVLQWQGRHEQAHALFDRTYQGYRDLKGEDHPDTSAARAKLHAVQTCWSRARAADAGSGVAASTRASQQAASDDTDMTLTDALDGGSGGTRAEHAGAGPARSSVDQRRRGEARGWCGAGELSCVVT